MVKKASEELTVTQMELSDLGGLAKSYLRLVTGAYMDMVVHATASDSTKRAAAALDVNPIASQLIFQELVGTALLLADDMRQRDPELAAKLLANWMAQARLTIAVAQRIEKEGRA